MPVMAGARKAPVNIPSWAEIHDSNGTVVGIVFVWTTWSATSTTRS
jgi:hypothetical protein